MRYLDGFRDPRAAAALRVEIHTAARGALARRPEITIMEVCGSHTMAIARYGIRDALPCGVRLVSGPGCPVCVTVPGYIDAAIALARRDVRIVTFGDLLNVPGSASTLGRCRAEGGTIEIVYGPAQALKTARAHPDRPAVFLAVGFETTIGPVLSLVDRAREGRINNLSLLTAFKLVPPALHALLADPAVRVDAFLCPAHVSAVIGSEPYAPFAARGTPCVIAGFEPLDILYGILGILRQIADGKAEVENQYARVVRPGGNPKIQALMARLAEPVAAAWRGLGTIPASGLALRGAEAGYDAARRFGLTLERGFEPPGCACGDVITGKRAPADCPLFGTACSPEHPVGPCMVSSEGSCAAEYRYAT
jgi:hydrogenase expression/formation protein HypD